MLACIDQSAEAERVCRQAKKLAREIGAPWVAVHVANPSSERGSREAKEQLLHTFRLAQDLGGETLTLNGENAAFEILSYAKTEGVTHVVLGASRHPLSRALVEAAGPGGVCAGAHETPGAGVEGMIDGGVVRLGKRAFAAPQASAPEDGAPELWFAHAGAPPVRFVFADALRADASETVAALRKRGYAVEMLSGDREEAVKAAATAAGISSWRAGVTPAERPRTCKPSEPPAASP